MTAPRPTVLQRLRAAILGSADARPAPAPPRERRAPSLREQLAEEWTDIGNTSDNRDDPEFGGAWDAPDDPREITVASGELAPGDAILVLSRNDPDSDGLLVHTLQVRDVDMEVQHWYDADATKLGRLVLAADIVRDFDREDLT